MPNWCFNRLTLTLPTPKRWEPIEMRQTRWEIFRNLKYKFENFHYNIENKQSEFFHIIKPRPKEENDNWENWNLCNWGSKWEPKFYKFQIKDNTINCIFETPWSNPYAIYIYLQRLNFEIEYCHASYENCDYGWGGTIWDESHYYEVLDTSFEELNEHLKDEEEIYYFDRLVHLLSPELDDCENEDMINFMVNCLAYYYDVVLCGYNSWKIKNNIDDSNEIKKENLKLKNKIMEWLEDDVKKNIKDEDSYIRISNTLKNSNYENTKNKIRVYLNNKFNMINHYNKKYEPELYLIYC